MLRCSAEVRSGTGEADEAAHRRDLSGPSINWKLLCEQDQRGHPPVLFREYISQMRLAVIIVAASMILGVTASALILMQKRSTQTATATSTIYIASGTQEVSSPPTRAPVSQTAQAAGSEASPFILQANVDTRSGRRTAVMQDPLTEPRTSTASVGYPLSSPSPPRRQSPLRWQSPLR
jgi:hypothetical protein